MAGFNVRALVSSEKDTSRLHNAPFHYVIDKSRTARDGDGTVG
jgi:hypothetical protein